MEARKTFLLNIRNLHVEPIVHNFSSCWLQVQWILQCVRQYERITLCLHLCIYLFPFLPHLAHWKTTDFSKEFSGLNIWSLMLLGEHGSAERRWAVATIQGRRTPAFISSMREFLQFSSSVPPWLQCAFQTLPLFLTVRPFTAVCTGKTQRWDASGRREENKGENWFDISCYKRPKYVQLWRLWHKWSKSDRPPSTAGQFDSTFRTWTKTRPNPNQNHGL